MGRLVIVASGIMTRGLEHQLSVWSDMDYMRTCFTEEFWVSTRKYKFCIHGRDFKASSVSIVLCDGTEHPCICVRDSKNAGRASEFIKWLTWVAKEVE